MRNTAFFLTGLALLFLQGNLFRILFWTHFPGLQPNLVLPLILFMGVHEYSLSRGAIVSFVLGYATDLIGISPIGLHAFTYISVFLLARAAGVRLVAQTTMTQIILAFTFALIHSAITLVLIAIFGRDAYVPRALYGTIIPHALVTGAIAPWIFRIAQQIHMVTGSGTRVDPVRGRR